MRWVVIVLILGTGFFVWSNFAFIATYEDGRVRGNEYWGVLLPPLITVGLAWAVHRLWRGRKDDSGKP